MKIHKINFDSIKHEIFEMTSFKLLENLLRKLESRYLIEFFDKRMYM